MNNTAPSLRLVVDNDTTAAPISAADYAGTPESQWQGPLPGELPMTAEVIERGRRHLAAIRERLNLPAVRTVDRRAEYQERRASSMSATAADVARLAGLAALAKRSAGGEA